MQISMFSHGNYYTQYALSTGRRLLEVGRKPLEEISDTITIIVVIKIEHNLGYKFASIFG